MSIYLNELIQSLERHAAEARAHLRTSRQPARTIAEQNLKRIEQHQIHIAELDASQRTAASNVLKTLQEDRARLLCYRSALLIEPSREYIN